MPEPAPTPAAMTRDQWEAEAVRRFGLNRSRWRFVCPCCRHVASVRDWLEAGAPEGAVAFSCVGRWLPEPRDAFDGSGPGPCNYAGGGLIGLNPVSVWHDNEMHHLFAFAEPETADV
jgi:hypothetical protein